MKYTTETTQYLNRIIKAAVDVMASSDNDMRIVITNDGIEVCCYQGLWDGLKEPVFDIDLSATLTADDAAYICKRLEKLYKEF